MCIKHYIKQHKNNVRISLNFVNFIESSKVFEAMNLETFQKSRFIESESMLNLNRRRTVWLNGM